MVQVAFTSWNNKKRSIIFYCVVLCAYFKVWHLPIRMYQTLARYHENFEQVLSALKDDKVLDLHGRVLPGAHKWALQVHNDLVRFGEAGLQS